MDPTFWLRIAANYVQTDSGRPYFVRPTLEVPTQGKPSSALGKRDFLSGGKEGEKKKASEARFWRVITAKRAAGKPLRCPLQNYVPT